MLTQKTLYLVATLSLGWISLSLGQDASGPPAAKEQQLPRARQGAFSPPTFPLMDTLDTDRDGKLSGDEIKAAPASLRKLDKNNDSKLSAEEIGWPPRRPGFPGGPGFPMGGPPGGLGERGGRSLAQRILDRDADGDGRVTIEELPKSMHFLMRLADADKDGSMDEKEAGRLAEQLGMSARRPGDTAGGRKSP